MISQDDLGQLLFRFAPLAQLPLSTTALKPDSDLASFTLKLFSKRPIKKAFSITFKTSVCNFVMTCTDELGPSLV